MDRDSSARLQAWVTACLERLPPEVPCVAASAASGAAVYVSCLAAAQLLVMRPLRLAAHLRLRSSLAGAAAVATAGIAASYTAVAVAAQPLGLSPAAPGFRLRDSPAVARAQRQLQRLALPAQLQLQLPPPLPAQLRLPSDVLLWAGSSLALFLALGGGFRRLAPSSLRHTGAFAYQSLPAQGKSYATASELDRLASFGRRYGCHTCGRRRPADGVFHGDHQPPNSLVKPGQSQKFFPQCKRCSNLQGGDLAQLRNPAATAAPLVTHATALRWYHLWLPIGPVLSVLLGWTNLRDYEQPGAEKSKPGIWSPLARLWQKLEESLLDIYESLHKAMWPALPGPSGSGEDKPSGGMLTRLGRPEIATDGDGSSLLVVRREDLYLEELERDLSKMLMLPEEKVVAVNNGVAEQVLEARRWPRSANREAVLEELRMLEEQLRIRAGGPAASARGTPSAGAGGSHGPLRDGQEQDLLEDDLAMTGVSLLLASQEAAEATAATMKARSAPPASSKSW